ncbi:MAG: asparaginase [Acidimicrobiia bacterium]
MSPEASRSVGHGRSEAGSDGILAVRNRSGLVETTHHGAVAVVGVSGNLIASAGDIETVFFLRSSAKPFQALIAQEAGADMSRQQLALACASHDGDPVHLALVEQMLDEVGLDESALRCPPSFPLGSRARDLVASVNTQPRRAWHNCSGKHAAWLRSCVANNWPTETYLQPDHPLQAQTRALVSELGSFPVDPVGVDGCGAPVLRTTVRAMATMFARMAGEERFGEVFAAMHNYPALVSGTENGDALIATAFHAAAKRGAAGCVAVAVKDQFGVGAKSWDGVGQVAEMAAAHALASVMPPVPALVAALEPVMSPPVLGGGEPVGSFESRLVL